MRSELAEMRESVFAATNSRSVLGTINDFSTPRGGVTTNPDADPLTVSLWLAETPMQPFRGKSPDILTRELLG